MKKKKFGYKLSRSSGARRALFKGLVKALVVHGSIRTTYTKAKAVNSEIARLVKLARKTDVASRRRVYARLSNDRQTSDKLFEIATNIQPSHKGGFVKLTQLGIRRGDSAQLARLEWAFTLKAIEKSTGKQARNKKGKAKKTKSTEEEVKMTTMEKLKSRLTKTKDKVK